MSGHGQTDKLLSPMRIIVRMPEPENLKDLSKSVKQAPHSEQATGHRTHCREILFTPRRIVQGPGSFLGRSTFLYDVRLCSYGASKGQGVSWVGRLFCTTYGCVATGRQTAAIFGFWPLLESTVAEAGNQRVVTAADSSELHRVDYVDSDVIIEDFDD